MPCDANAEVWIPFSPYVAFAKKSRVVICSDCFDDSEPRVELHKGAHCTMADIDPDGDFKLQLDDRMIWIFQQRSSLLRICTTLRAIAEEHQQFQADFEEWKLKAADS